mgnify:CR=1 FL=1
MRFGACRCGPDLEKKGQQLCFQRVLGGKKGGLCTQIGDVPAQRQMVSPDAVVQVRRGGSPPRSPSLGTTSRAWAQPWAMREASIW